MRGAQQGCSFRREAAEATMQMNNLQTIHFETAQAPDGSSMYMDLTLPGHLARVTVGQVDGGRGYCDTEILNTEILNTETEETVQWQHQEFGGASELNAVLTDFFARLRDLPDTAPTSGAAFMLPLAGHTVRLPSLLRPLLAAAGE